MSSRIEKNMEMLLQLIYGIDEKGGGNVSIKSVTLQRDARLTSYDIDEALELLSQGGMIEGTPSNAIIPLYKFESVKITPKGRAKFKKTETIEEFPITSKNPRQVFVVHGRNQKARDSIFIFLRTIGLHPLEWSELVKATGKGSPYVGEILDRAFSEAQAVVVLMTPDDEGQLRQIFRKPDDPMHETELTPQARLNVVFEAGMAMGRNSQRTIIVELGGLRPFSDVVGRHVIKLDNTSQKRQELAQRLQTAGCTVNLNGTDWHTDGNFSL
jgi:predicted nucleotide-binding protein